MIDKSNIKTTDWLTKGMTEKQIQKEKEKALKEFEHTIKKQVKIICPKCGNIMTYKNWFSWILHTPFHWFGKRRAKCNVCGQVSYTRREKN